MARTGRAPRLDCAPTGAETAGPDGATAQNRRQAVAAADAELDAVADQLQALLQQRHPSLFDRQGRLRQRALAAALTEQTGQKTLTKAEVLRLTEQMKTAPSSGMKPRTIMNHPSSSASSHLTALSS